MNVKCTFTRRLNIRQQVLVLPILFPEWETSSNNGVIASVKGILSPLLFHTKQFGNAKASCSIQVLCRNDFEHDSTPMTFCIAFNPFQALPSREISQHIRGAAPMIGTTIRHYKVLEKIGQGGRGEVYCSEDTNLSREVAIKVLPPSSSQKIPHATTGRTAAHSCQTT